MTPPNPIDAELTKETQEFIRFMLRDHAFSQEFLVTAVQEYFRRNLPVTQTQSNTAGGYQKRESGKQRQTEDVTE